VIRSLALFAGLALASAAGAQERPWTPLPSPVSATCPGGICQPEGLDGFFMALNGTGPVRVVQFGDSHTAGGDITTSLLWRLQGRLEGREIGISARGVVGATLRGFAAQEPLLDPDGFRPDLIILAYGVNEGFDDALDPGTYEALLRRQVARVRESVPAASLLILGAPEAMRGDGGGTCEGDPERRWKAPAMLSVVRDVQHRVAADMGVAFWDWRGRMGGDCSAHALTLGNTPLMRGDHVHFTGSGGDWIGSLLFADLMAVHDQRGGR
jgi:lysophospholipase L1-like esterase